VFVSGIMPRPTHNSSSGRDPPSRSPSPVRNAAAAASDFVADVLLHSSLDDTPAAGAPSSHDAHDVPSSVPGNVASGPDDVPLLPLLDPAYTQDSAFFSWFEATFGTRPEHRSTLLAYFEDQPSHIMDWLHLLKYAWSSSEAPRRSDQFGMQLLALFASSVSTSFLQSFLMFYPRQSSGAPAPLTPVSSHAAPRTFPARISDGVFEPLRTRFRGGNLPGTWPQLVNECFDAATGGHVITFTDLGHLTPLAIMLQLGAHNDVCKFIHPDLRTTAATPSVHSRGTLESIMADGANRTSDMEIFLSLNANISSLLVLHTLSDVQTEHLTLLVDFLSSELRHFPGNSELMKFAQELNNLCAFACLFCTKLCDVLVASSVKNAEHWRGVVQSICPPASQRQLKYLTHGSGRSRQVPDPLMFALCSFGSFSAVLPAFQAVIKLMETLAVLPSQAKHDVLVSFLSFTFNFSASFESEIVRLLDLRAKALLSLGKTQFYEGGPPALYFEAIQEMLSNILSGVSLERSDDRLALEHFKTVVLKECKTFEDLLHGARACAGEHALRGNPADARAASVHAASSVATHRPSSSRHQRHARPSQNSSARAQGPGSSGGGRPSTSHAAGAVPKPQPISATKLSEVESLGIAVESILFDAGLEPSDYLRKFEFQGSPVFAWLQDRAGSSSNAVRVPSSNYAALPTPAKTKVLALMRAGDRQYRQNFVADVFGSQVRSLPMRSQAPAVSQPQSARPTNNQVFNALKKLADTNKSAFASLAQPQSEVSQPVPPPVPSGRADGSSGRADGGSGRADGGFTAPPQPGRSDWVPNNQPSGGAQSLLLPPNSQGYPPFHQPMPPPMPFSPGMPYGMPSMPPWPQMMHSSPYPQSSDAAYEEDSRQGN